MLHLNLRTGMGDDLCTDCCCVYNTLCWSFETTSRGWSLLRSCVYLFVEALKLRHEADRCCEVACTSLLKLWNYVTRLIAVAKLRVPLCWSFETTSRGWSLLRSCVYLFAEALKLRHEADRCCEVACTSLLKLWNYVTRLIAVAKLRVPLCWSFETTSRGWSLLRSCVYLFAEALKLRHEADCCCEVACTFLLKLWNYVTRLIAVAKLRVPLCWSFETTSRGWSLLRSCVYLFVEALKLRHEADRCCEVACTSLLKLWNYVTRLIAVAKLRVPLCWSFETTSRGWSLLLRTLRVQHCLLRPGGVQTGKIRNRFPPGCWLLVWS